MDFLCINREFRKDGCECFFGTCVICDLQVDHGLDLEQHLAFLIDCRATFGNMDLLRVMFLSLVGHFVYNIKIQLKYLH